MDTQKYSSKISLDKIYIKLKFSPTTHNICGKLLHTFDDTMILSRLTKQTYTQPNFLGEKESIQKIIDSWAIIPFRTSTGIVDINTLHNPETILKSMLDDGSISKTYEKKIWKFLKSDVKRSSL